MASDKDALRVQTAVNIRARGDGRKQMAGGAALVLPLSERPRGLSRWVRETVPEGVGRDVLLDPGGLPIGEAALI